MFTKRHFEQTAKLIRESGLSLEDRFTITCEFARMFRDFNPRFNNERFIDACKAEDERDWDRGVSVSDFTRGEL